MENVKYIRNLKRERNFKYKINVFFGIIIFFLNISLIICDSEIHLIIQWGWFLNILSERFKTNPSQVKINGITKNCLKSCQLEGDKNDVSLTFNEIIISCEYMFYRLENITEIDFSNFDFSQVTDISNMLSGCKKLEKIIFSPSIITSSLEKMSYAFLIFLNWHQ